MIVFALDGPTPMLISVMPRHFGATRWYAGICGWRGGTVPDEGALSPLRVTRLPGSTKAVYSSSPAAMRSRARRQNSSM